MLSAGENRVHPKTATIPSSYEITLHCQWTRYVTRRVLRLARAFVHSNCLPLQLLPFMHSDNEQKQGSESSSTFRKSIQKFVYEQEVEISPLRRSLRQQQKLACVEPTTEADEQRLLDVPSRKRRPSQEICSSPERKESPSPSTRMRMIRSPKRKRGYAPPEAYAHLREINDCIKLHLDGKIPKSSDHNIMYLMYRNPLVLFVGIKYVAFSACK